jgi:hypothetical protein
MADMTWTGTWNGICVVDKFIHPCNYTMSVDFDTTDGEVIHQHTAFSRIKFFVEEVLHESIVISMDSVYLPALKDSHSRIICLSNEPLDVTLAAALWSKMESFCEGHLEFQRISLSSDMGDGLVSHIDVDFVESIRDDLLNDPFVAHGSKIWWNRPDLSVSDWIEVTEREGKPHAAIHIEERDWPDFLSWDDDITDTKPDNGENVVSIKNRERWKPEVIPGDKT